jgi:hypothetical protein
LSAENTTQIAVQSCCTAATVDIKANNSDGPITIPYNSAANLTWTSQNANSCTASGTWSGTKSISGSESSGNLTSAKSYTITCSNSCGQAADTVTVYIESQPTLSVSLSANPNSGCAPLNNVDLTSSVSGTASGEIIYFFDCTNDGVWEKTIISGNAIYTASDLCNYSSAGNYTAKTRVQREGLSAENTTQIAVQSCYTAPIIDIKANNSDGPITIPYDSAANLTWTSTNADSCNASNAWSGTKATSGSQSTGNLTSSKTYTITCSGSGGSASDSVVINVGASQNNPPTADAGPDKDIYENQSVTLNGSGYDPDGYSVSYYWSCNGGSLSNRYIAQPTFYAPSVSSNNYYTCDLTVTDNEGLTDFDSMRVLVRNETTHSIVSTVSLDISKSVKNLSKGDTQWYNSYRSSDPDDKLLFQIEVKSTGDTEARDVMVKDNLPDNIIYQGNLKIDNVYSSKNITTGAVNIGDLSSGQTKTITFEAKVESKDKFNYGTTDLINTGLAYNTETSVTDTCKVIVKKTAVAGAATSISTGISNGILNSILLPLIITLAIVWIFRSKLIGFDEWSEKKKKETEEYRANKLLKKKIAQLRTQGIV